MSEVQHYLLQSNIYLDESEFETLWNGWLDTIDPCAQEHQMFGFEWSLDYEKSLWKICTTVPTARPTLESMNAMAIFLKTCGYTLSKGDHVVTISDDEREIMVFYWSGGTFKCKLDDVQIKVPFYEGDECVR